MLGRVAACGAAAAIMLPVLLSPAQSAAKGFVAAPFHHGGAFRFHFGRHGHGHHDHRRNPYAYGYGYWPLGYEYGNAMPQEVAVPTAYPVYVTPRCVHSVETVVVPSEDGGERRIRITRC